MTEVLSGWIDSTLANRIALTLVHVLWQGMLIAILVWLIGAVLRNKSANTRYSVFVGGLLSMAVCAAMTFVVVEGNNHNGSVGSVNESPVIARPLMTDIQDDSMATEFSVLPGSDLSVTE